MSRMKKILSSILALFLFIGLINIPINAKAAEVTKTYVKVYYVREDKNYAGWNLWVWVNDASGTNLEAGHAEEFDGVDSKGAYKIIAKDSDKKLGLIVRTEAWDKCYNDDVIVDLSEGDKEVNFVQATKSYEVVEPQQEFENVTAKIHYYRFEDDYDNWDLWAWTTGANGAVITFDEVDDFGKVATVECGELTEDTTGEFIVRVSDWSDREQSNGNDGNRLINKTCINADGEVDVYVVQGDKNEYYTLAEANLAKEPKIFSAKINTLNSIAFTTSFDITSESPMSVTDSKGNELTITNVTIESDSKSGSIEVEEGMDFAEEIYTLSITNAQSKKIMQQITLGQIFASEDFKNLYTYNGELGALYSKYSTTFVLWAPTASKVDLLVYGIEGRDLSTEPIDVIEMTKGEKGTWVNNISGDLNGVYYNYSVTVGGSTNEVVDPYAKAVGVNGERGMVVDLDSTDPENWSRDVRQNLKSATDATIYELHVRDFTIGNDSGVQYAGKFEGLWESGTKIPTTDISTAIDHIKDLGVNTIQIMPMYDYTSVDEENLDSPQFNWGYDPENYNAVEGSYSSNPYYAETRIKELKELIQAFHKEGIRVTMDVVYNHTSLSETSYLNLTVPNYYYRQNESGGFSNGSGCGNEIASERSMVRKMLVDSVVYWAEEYHLDGFRFDLMACLDTTTMLEIRAALDKIDPNISIIGEGWTGGTSSLDGSEQSLKASIGSAFGDKQIAAFSDDMRDGIKGHVFTSTAPAFINGGQGFEEKIKFGIVAATEHDGIDYENVGSSAWASQPYQTVNYCSAHDNLTLYDKLKTTNPDATEEEIMSMNKMAAALIYTSQGIAFMLSGEEFARTKVNADGTYNENSYNASDEVNNIGWSRLQEPLYKDLYKYYKGLLSVRNNHKAFRMDTTADIQNNLTFLDMDKENVVAYTIDGEAVGDNWGKIAVVFNANTEAVEVELPSSDWLVVVNGEKAGNEIISTITGKKVTVEAQASYVLVEKSSYTDIIEGNVVENDGKYTVEVDSLNNEYNKYKVELAENSNSVLIKDIEELKNKEKVITIVNRNITTKLPFSALSGYLDEDVTAIEFVSTIKDDSSALTALGVKGIGKIIELNLLVYKRNSNEPVSIHNLSSEVTVSVEFDETDFNGLNIDKLKMAYINDDKIEYLQTNINGVNVTFNTPHFSQFALIEETTNVTPPIDDKDDKGDNKTTDSNKTGDNSNTVRLITILGASVLAVAIIGVTFGKKREEEEV